MEENNGINDIEKIEQTEKSTQAIVAEVVQESAEVKLENKKKNVQEMKAEIEKLQEEYNECRELINQYRKSEDEEKAASQEEIGNKLLNQIAGLKEQKRLLQEEIENIDKEKNEKEEENIVENSETVESVEQYKKKFDFNSIFEAIGQFWKVCKAKVLKIVKNEKLLAEKTGKGEK
jgi:predicted  nucleic acid-binding Zn-ribbon protein